MYGVNQSMFYIVRLFTPNVGWLDTQKKKKKKSSIHLLRTNITKVIISCLFCVAMFFCLFFGMCVCVCVLGDVCERGWVPFFWWQCFVVVLFVFWCVCVLGGWVCVWTGWVPFLSFFFWCVCVCEIWIHRSRNWLFFLVFSVFFFFSLLFIVVHYVTNYDTVAIQFNP